jgi:DNA polymerase-3 subunit beta
MKFTIERDVLLPALTYAAGVAEKKPGVMPMLSCVVLSAMDGQLALAATDLVSFVQVYVPAEVSASKGVAVGAKAFLDIVKKLPDGLVSVSVNERYQVTVKAGSASFKPGGTDPSGMPTFPPAPKLRDGDFNYSAMELRRAIYQTVYATRDDEVNLALCGVYFDDGVAVATDKHRLALTEYQGLLRNTILPRKGLEELVKVLKGAGEDLVGIEEADGYVIFTVPSADNSVVLSMKKVDSDFIPYREVLPESQPYHFTCPSIALAEACKRVALMSENKKNVRVRANGNTLMVSAESHDGSAEEEIEGTYDGRPVTVVLNADFVVEALDRIDSEEVVLGLESDRSPVVIMPAGGAGAKALIMPWG